MTNEKKTPNARIYALIARNAPVGVVFRRGPSSQVLLLHWDLETDEFTEGQWFKGRIYERRSDLSPSGKRLIYFAANFKEPYYSWTAVSRPPYLTAVAMWPKGDCWGGGGVFNKEKEILLNHREDEMKLTEDSNLPNWIKVEGFGEHPGHGEDSPLLEYRLERDGWTFIQAGKEKENKEGAPVWIEFKPPSIMQKPQDVDGVEYVLKEYLHGIHERDGSWYVTEHTVTDSKSGKEISLGRTDWADWCKSGDLLFSLNGKIFRTKADKDNFLRPLEKAKQLIDLTDRTFEARKSPEMANKWSGEI